MHLPIHKTPLVFQEEPELAIKEELLSIHAICPFVCHSSSNREYMASSHLSQALTINNGDEKLVQTGLEKQLSTNTFSKKAESDLKVWRVIPRYRGIGTTTVSDEVEKLVLVMNVDESGEEELDFIRLTKNHNIHQYFGFKYNFNEQVVNNLVPGSFLPKGTILADSPSVARNGGYKYGVNANLCLLNIPETSEDGVIISQRLAEKMNFTMYETKVIEFGTKCIPINLYGDDDHYKPFPDIGEQIGADCLVMALRDYDDRLQVAISSVKDLQDYNPVFDRCVYGKLPAEIKNIGGVEVKSGTVVDVKIYYNPKSKKDIYSGMGDNLQKYVKGLSTYYKDIIQAYDDAVEEHKRRYGRDANLKVSEKLHRLIIEAKAIINEGTKSKIRYTARNEQLDIYRVELKIEYVVVPNIKGYKISDSHGSKGVIVEVRPNHEMPRDIYGNVADVIMDPSSVISRMNISRLYEQAFGAMSRKTQLEMKKAMNFDPGRPLESYNDKEIKAAYEILLGMLAYIGNEQYEEYLKVKDIATMREVVEECVTEEVYILFRPSGERKAYQILQDVKGSIYEPVIDRVRYFSYGEEKISKEPVMIAPVYSILLSKTAENPLAVASAKLNHFGLPVGVNSTNKGRAPHKATPTKILSETESRLIPAYVGELALLELKDRANSVETHEHVYRNILDAEQPTNMSTVVNRDVIKYGNDAALSLLENILNPAGIKMVYTPDPNIKHK